MGRGAGLGPGRPDGAGTRPWASLVDRRSSTAGKKRAKTREHALEERGPPRQEAPDRLTHRGRPASAGPGSRSDMSDRFTFACASTEHATSGTSRGTQVTSVEHLAFLR